MTKHWQQLIPLILTVVTFVGLSLFLFCFISLLNGLPFSDKIVLHLRLSDILVGLTIYLKTSVDFAIFIGNLMSNYMGIKNRIAIEVGTALGNAIGTCGVLLIWTFFKEVPILMIGMIFLASLVLLHLAEDGLGEFLAIHKVTSVETVLSVLQKINAFFYPLLRFVVPHGKTKSSGRKTFLMLLIFSFSVPLILGLDDFAGYIPLFNIVNVFGFAIGVFLGHMILNLALFASPTHTIKAVKQPIIALLGSIAFIGIALWGFYEVIKIIQELL